jgi:hypothetical protein
MPLFVRKFIVDAVETGVAALLTVEFIVPDDIASAVGAGGIVGAALLGAVVAAARRAAPGFLEWFRGKVPTEE